MTETLASLKALSEEMGRKLGDMIFDPADIPDMDGVAKMDRRQLQAAAAGLARAAARARAFEPDGVIAEAEQKVKTLGDLSGYPSFAAGMRDGFHEQAAAVKPRFVKLSSLVAVYDDAAREQVLFLLRHYDRVVRCGRGGIRLREQHLADAYNKLVGARNRSSKVARAWAHAIGQDPAGLGI